MVVNLFWAWAKGVGLELAASRSQQAMTREGQEKDYLSLSLERGYRVRRTIRPVFPGMGWFRERSRRKKKTMNGLSPFAFLIKFSILGKVRGREKKDKVDEHVAGLSFLFFKISDGGVIHGAGCATCSNGPAPRL